MLETLGQWLRDGLNLLLKALFIFDLRTWRAKLLARELHASLSRYIASGNTEALRRINERLWAIFSQNRSTQIELGEAKTRLNLLLILPIKLNTPELKVSVACSNSQVTRVRRLLLFSSRGPFIWLQIGKQVLSDSGMASTEGMVPRRVFAQMVSHPVLLRKVLNRTVQIQLEQSYAEGHYGTLTINDFGIIYSRNLGAFSRGIPISLSLEGHGKQTAEIVHIYETTVLPTKRLVSMPWQERFVVRSDRDLLTLATITASHEILSTLAQSPASRTAVSAAKSLLSSRPEDQRARSSGHQFALLGAPLVASHDGVTALTSHAQFRSPQIAHLENIELWHGRFVIKDGVPVITESGSDTRASHVAGNHWLYIPNSGHPDQTLVVEANVDCGHLEEAILATGRADDNWFHFIVETLPRVLRASINVSSNVPLVSRADLPKSAKEALHALTGRNEVAVKHGERLSIGSLKFSTLMATTLDAPFLPKMQGFFDSDGLHLVRQATWDAVKKTPAADRTYPSKIVYLRASHYRRLLNRQQVLERLNASGFQAVPTSGLGFAQQVAAFRNAREVVVQGGAGMANLVFCKPGTLVTVLCGQEWGQPAYWSQFLQILGLEASIVVGYRRGRSRGPHGVHSDFEVPLRGPLT